MTPNESKEEATRATSPGHAKSTDFVPHSSANPSGQREDDPANSQNGAGREGVPGYDVLGVLGHGGMGVVYKALQRGLNRTVALKMIRSGADAGEEELVRFRIEAQAGARLQHPNIVQIYEVGEADGQPFLSMEFVEGASLAQKLADKPQPPRDAARTVQLLAAAVQYAHEHGIVHRDLKPANVLFTTEGTPKISDFGLAKLVEGSSVHTQSGTILGTPSYMAPEQAMGQRGETGPLADVYSLGAIIYELLTGRPPFKGETVLETLEQVCTQAPVAPSKLKHGVPRDLDTICLKCLAKDPARRYQSALLLAQDLDRFQAGKAILGRRESLAGRLWGRARRNWVVSTTALAVASALIALYFWFTFSAEEKFEEKFVLKTGRGPVNAVAFSPNGKWLAAGTKDQAILLYDPETGKEIKTLKVGAEVNGLAFSPHEPYLLASACGDNLVRIWNPANDDPPRVLQGHIKEVRAVAFSPLYGDGSFYVASGSEDSTVQIWDGKTLKPPPVPVVQKHTKSVTGVAFHPTQKLLASCSKDKTICLWDLNNPKEPKVNDSKAEVMGVVFLGPDGKFLAGSSLDKSVRTWAVDSGNLQLVLYGPEGGMFAVAYSQDGMRLAGGSSDGTVWLWDVAAKKELKVFKGHEAGVRAVAFSPDGQRLASASLDGTVRVWKVPGEKSIASVLASGGGKVTPGD